jgi:integral membrane protein
MNSRAIALNVYRVLAYVTGTGLIILVFVAMPLKYFAGMPKPVAIVGALHGFLYMAYVVCALVLAERCRWRPVRAVLVALAGTIPFLSFVAERKVTRWVRAMGPARKDAAGGSVGAAGGAERAADQQPDLHA